MREEDGPFFFNLLKKKKDRRFFGGPGTEIIFVVSRTTSTMPDTLRNMQQGRGSQSSMDTTLQATRCDLL